MTTTPSTRIELPAQRIAAFCRRWGLACLEVFGSALRDDFRADSDVDFLYTPGPRFKREQAFGPWGHNHMAEELAGIVGRPVELLERRQVERHRNWIRRQHILRTTQPLYDEVDLEVVWQVTQEHAPKLARYLQGVLPEPPNTERE